MGLSKRFFKKQISHFAYSDFSYYYDSRAFIATLTLFNFLKPFTKDQAVTRRLPKRRTTKAQDKDSQTSVPRVGFEHNAPVFERAKEVHGNTIIIIAANAVGKFLDIFADRAVSLHSMQQLVPN
jgi:hypothetical protein